MRWQVECQLNCENVESTLNRSSQLFESWLLFYIERIVFLMKMIMFNSIQVINYWFILHRALRPLYQQAQTFSPNIWGILDQNVTHIAWLMLRLTLKSLHVQRSSSYMSSYLTCLVTWTTFIFTLTALLKPQPSHKAFF